MSGVLLDTNAFIRIVAGQTIRHSTMKIIADAASEQTLWVSAITGWELGLLLTRSRTRQVLNVEDDPMSWFDRTMTKARMRHLALDASVGLSAAFLPAPFHSDPGDRLIVAQAIARDLTIATSDRAILDYAAAGHVRAIAC